MMVPQRVANTNEADTLKAESSRTMIPDGDYVAVCYRTRVVHSFGKAKKLEVWFRVVEGCHAGAELAMYCTYPEGRITASRKLYIQWSLAIGRRPIKGERFSQKVFRGKMFRVAVRKVPRQFKDGTPMPDYLSYSVVDTIKETITGIPACDH
jgi:hypothetical protein